MLKMKKNLLWVLGGAAAVVCLLFVLILKLSAVPHGYIAIDVNPSIELETDRNNRVVAIHPANQDARELLTGYAMDSNELDDVVEDIVDRLYLAGYLTDNSDNKILITADEKTTSPALLEKVNTSVSNYLNVRKLNATILKQSIDVSEQLLADAHNNQMSAGKYTIVERILQEDKTLTAADLAGTSLKDLIAFASQKNVDLNELVDEYHDALDDVMEQKGIHDVDDDILDLDDDGPEKEDPDDDEADDRDIDDDRDEPDDDDDFDDLDDDDNKFDPEDEDEDDEDHGKQKPVQPGNRNHQEDKDDEDDEADWQDEDDDDDNEDDLDEDEEEDDED
ncbi:anti-sigma-I factor RsgI family protein [Anaerolentibacter hominis]|uniref:anti-sigma-I factor RsgI family protein n=1 Tax=Anaerolentibacter hominis TaxID=3079009 RepID=UPI0031B840CE